MNVIDRPLGSVGERNYNDVCLFAGFERSYLIVEAEGFGRRLIDAKHRLFVAVLEQPAVRQRAEVQRPQQSGRPCASRRVLAQQTRQCCGWCHGRRPGN